MMNANNSIKSLPLQVSAVFQYEYKIAYSDISQSSKVLLHSHLPQPVAELGE